MLTPFLYSDARAYGPEHNVIVCPTCAFTHVHIVGLGWVHRDNYEVLDRRSIEEVPVRSARWKGVALNEHVQFGSLVLELRCEMGHTSVIELGLHKGLLSARLSRLEREPGPDDWRHLYGMDDQLDVALTRRGWSSARADGSSARFGHDAWTHELHAGRGDYVTMTPVIGRGYEIWETSGSGRFTLVEITRQQLFADIQEYESGSDRRGS